MGYFFNSLLKYGFQKKENGGGGEITVDSELSEISKNPVQNKVITSTLQKKITKFFTAADELEPGEIAQYQGEDDSANGLKNGFFYKKETTAGLVLPAGTKIKKYSNWGEPILYLISSWNYPYINTWREFIPDNNGHYFVQFFSKDIDTNTIPEPFKTALMPFSDLKTYDGVEYYLTQLQSYGFLNSQKSITPLNYSYFDEMRSNPAWSNNIHDLIYCCDPNGNRYITDGFTLWELDENNKVKGTLYDDGDGATLKQFRWETTEEINFSKTTFTQVDTQPQPQQPQTEKNIFVVNAQTINTNINECLSVLTELKQNDLIIFSDIDETKIYNYTYNSITKNFKGNADFDLIFRYAGNGEFKPISFSPIF